MFDQGTWRLVSCVSLFRSHHFISRRHVVPWEVARQFEHSAFNARASCPFIIKVCDVLFHPDHNCWFKFLKKSFISTINLASMPPAINFHWTRSNGQDLIILRLIKGEIFFPFFHFFTLHLPPSPFFPFFFQSPHSLKFFLFLTFVEVNFRQSSDGTTVPQNTRSWIQYSRAYFLSAN